MMKKVSRLLLLAAIAGLTLGGFSASLAAEGSKGDIKRGALLYDKWYGLTGTKVEGNHPSYPAEGQKSGGSTWRCKECHGWDYIGKDGRYSKGSHYTGIVGVYDLRDQNAQELYQAIAAPGTDHDFAKDLSPEDILSLVEFIRNGLIDTTSVIAADGSAMGSSEKGKPLYASNCTDCHGEDGNAIDFKSKKDGIQGVGYITKDNPPESLHKIRWGHPGSDMGSVLVDAGLTEADAVDILAYCQTFK